MYIYDMYNISEFHSLVNILKRKKLTSVFTNDCYTNTQQIC